MLLDYCIIQVRKLSITVLHAVEGQTYRNDLNPFWTISLGWTLPEMVTLEVITFSILSPGSCISPSAVAGPLQQRPCGPEWHACLLPLEPESIRNLF